ncbi:hypothetical protein BDV33DRAFT_210663 [Aspergillus novoparasiticus]|uniref:Uncharacterized protein n=1 Tax=Aspergillus novoparasiticus TaxID=986946 RepID=A0A5N6E831_9EURO|nr:hypothetical protein BDV33DRAFT_210663 [Aspergillus novoparasiticus]
MYQKQEPLEKRFNLLQIVIHVRLLPDDLTVQLAYVQEFLPQPVQSVCRPAVLAVGSKHSLGEYSLVPWILEEVPPAPSENIKQRKEVISLDRVLHTILNEALTSLQDTVQSSRWQRKGTRTFCYLFDMLVKDDPTLRVMGLCPVLRTIERELSNGNVHHCDAMPSSLQQALNDISVVSVCKEEASTHYQYIRNINYEYASLANKAETEWNEREKPWISLINRTPESLGRRVNNLNQSLSNRKQPLSEKHRKFWTGNKSLL